MAGVFLYAIFAAIASVLRAMLSRPLLAIALIFFALLTRSCYGWGSIDLPNILVSDETQIAQYLGRPEGCTNDGQIVCSYDSAEVTYSSGHLVRIAYNGYAGFEFPTSPSDFHKLTDALSLPYKAPIRANMDEIVWQYPWGRLTVRSTTDLHVGIIDAQIL